MKIEKNNVYNCDCILLMNKMLENGYECNVDFVLTDPPYGINFQPQRTADKFSIIPNDDLSGENLYSFLKEYFTLCYKLLKDDSFLVSFMGWSTIPEFNKAILDAGFSIKSMPIWYKNNFGIGYYTRPQYEPMYLCIKGKPTPPENPISDVLRFDKVCDLIHSCQKPIDLLCKLINTFSKEDDLVFDGFGGSFSTCVASRKCGRNFISCEIDEKLFKIWNKNLFNETNQISLFD